MKQKDVTHRPTRRDRLIRERVHDPYKSRLKPAENAHCPQCGAVFQGGRWTWNEPPEGAREETCQACHRANDDYPAGTVTISGDFVDAHLGEILDIVRKQEHLAKGEHPLHRIMSISEQPEQIAIKTTDLHLPRRIGKSLSDAYQPGDEVAL